MRKCVRKCKEEKEEQLVELLIPFHKKKEDRNGFYFWIGSERYLVPLSLVIKIREEIAKYKQENIIKQEGYHMNNVSMTLSDEEIRLVMKLLGV